MSYIRTKEIRDKQSASTKKRLSENPPNWEEIKLKTKLTHLKKGTKPGRKPGDGPKKTGIYKPCPTCKSPVYHTSKNIKDNLNKHCSKKCLHSNPLYLEKLKNVDRSYQTKEKGWGTWNIKEDLDEYKKYRGAVNRLSEKNYVNSFSVINPNNLPRTISGVEGGYQLDHIIPVRKCFDLGMSINEAAAVSNLRMLPWRDNLARNKRGNNL